MRASARAGEWLIQTQMSNRFMGAEVQSSNCDRLIGEISTGSQNYTASDIMKLKSSQREWSASNASAKINMCVCVL